MSVQLPPNSAIWQWMILPLRRYADFNGRSGRREFWFYCLFLLVHYVVATISLIGSIAAFDVGGTDGAWGGALVWSAVFAVVYIVNFVPGLALSARRLHDLGLSGWLLFAAAFAIMILSVFGWIAYMIVMSLPPQKHANQYGPPVGDKDLVQDVFA